MGQQDASARADARLTKTREEAEAHARQIRIDNNATVRRYYTSAHTLLNQGRQHVSTGDWEIAFILLMRFATFFLEMMPEHPMYSDPSMAKDRKHLKHECRVRREGAAERQPPLTRCFRVWRAADGP